MKRLTNKQQAFVCEYVKDHNGTQAAIRAGYSRRTANEQAARLLAKVSVQAKIQKYQERAKSDATATLSECCIRLTEIIRANVTDFMDKSGILTIDGKKNLCAVQEFVQRIDDQGAMVTKIKLRDPIQAMARLAAFLGMDKPKQLELDNKVDIIIPDTLKGLD